MGNLIEKIALEKAREHLYNVIRKCDREKVSDNNFIHERIFIVGDANNAIQIIDELIKKSS